MYVQKRTYRSIYTEAYIQKCTYRSMHRGAYIEKCTYRSVHTEAYIQKCTYRSVHTEVYIQKHTYRSVHTESYIQVITLYTVPYVSMCPDLSLLAQPCQSCGNTRVKHNICLRKKSWAGCIYMKSVRCPILYFYHHCWLSRINLDIFIACKLFLFAKNLGYGITWQKLIYHRFYHASQYVTPQAILLGYYFPS